MGNQEYKEFSKFLKERGMPSSTIKTYVSIVKTFNRAIVDEVTEDKIIDFVERHQKYYTGAIKRWLKFNDVTVDWGIINEKTKRLRRTQIPSRELSFEEIRILTSKLEYPYDKIVMLQFEFGARVREILNIVCENITLSPELSGDESIKIVLRTKGGKSRVVFTISEDAKNFLIPYIGKQGLMFPRDLFIKKTRIINHDEDMKEERIVRSVYWNVWNNIKKEAKLTLNKNISTHWFRHARITYLYDMGWDVRTIQKFTGHSSLDMVQKYLISAGLDTKKLAVEEKKKGGLKW